MKRASLEIEFVTPCFLAGADQTAAAEWRAASIRGQLRWWFRAVAGGELGGDLAKIRAAESEVFGSTDRRSALSIHTAGHPGYWEFGSPWPLDNRMTEAQLASAWGVRKDHSDYEAILTRLRVFNPVKREQTVRTDPLQYLAFGCISYHRGQGVLLDRSCIAPKETGSLRLQWRDSGPTAPRPETWELFERSLWAWLHLGGLGSKARNGFGSLRCTGIQGDLGKGADGFELHESRTDLEADIRKLLARSRTTGPEADEACWTQLGPDSRVQISTQTYRSWHEAQATAGAWLVAYRRRYGYADDERERNGQSVANRDYAWAAPRGRDRRSGFPDRGGFGLPLPFGEHGETLTWFDPTDDRRDGDRRRASPLLLHVAQVQEGYLPVLIYLPSKYLPEGGKLRFKGTRKPASAPSASQTGVVSHFLDDLRSKNLVQEATP